MKKQITLIGFLALMVAATALIAAGTQQDKDKKEQKQNDNKQQGKPDKAKDQGNDKGQGQGKNDDKGNQGKDDKDNKGQGNTGDKGNGNDKNDNSGKNDENKGQGQSKDKIDLSDKNFKWDRETFKDRKDLRNAEKVTLCHKFNSRDEPAVTIRVSANALKAHLNHGDKEGECPELSSSTWSKKFLNRRTDYYNELQEANEQLIYSRSILDYAKDRLALAQQQLAAQDASRYTMQQIQQRQQLVTDLEQNVSLLEALVTTAATVLVNKLSD